MHQTLFVLRPLLVLFLFASTAHAQPNFSKTFTPNSIGPGSVSTITFTVDNSGEGDAMDLAFTDLLPAGLVIADPTNASTDCSLDETGSLSAPAGGTTITLIGGRVGISQTCRINVDVTAAVAGVYTNPVITLSTSNGDSMSSAVDLTVLNERVGFSKSFAPNSISLGERSTLTFTLDNSLNPDFATSLQFTDNLPTGMVVANPANASTDCNVFGPPTLTAIPGSSSINLTNGNIAAMSTCTVTVDVLATGIGMLHNVTSDLTGPVGITPGPASHGKASATLASSNTTLALTKEFTDDPVAPNGTVTLVFTLTNFDRSASATNLAFTDDLTTLAPALAGLTFDSLLSNDCGGSVLGFGGTTLTVSGGSLAPQSSCTISVSLAVPSDATPGAYVNTTNTLTGDLDSSPEVGNTASDTLFVDPRPIFTKEFIDDPVTGGDTVTLRFTIQNTDPDAGLTDLAFTDDLKETLGDLLANSLVDVGGLEPEPIVDPCGAGSLLTIPDPNDTLPPNVPAFPPDPTILAFTGGSLAEAGMMGDTCTFDVVLDVPAAPSGLYTNTTSELTSATSGADPATDDLVIVAAPALQKEFTDDPIAPGGTATLSFTLSYPAEAVGNATDITFTDDLDAMGITGLVVNLPVVPDPPCGAGSSLMATGNLLTLADGVLMPGETCTFSVTVDVPALTTPGNYTNTTSVVSATVQALAVTSSAVSDDLNVAGLSFTKEFLNDPVIAGDTVTLRFTIANIHPTDDATGIIFTDNLTGVLSGLSATLPPAADTCGGVMSGPTFLIYTGGSVTSGASCTIDLEVQVPGGVEDGPYSNITSNLSATQGGAVVIDPATDILDVNSTLLQLTKSFTDDPVAPGDPVTLEFILTNLDTTRAASSIAFSDDLTTVLTDLTFDSVLLDTCSGLVSAPGGGATLIEVSDVSLAAGASCTLRVSLTVPGDASAGIYANTSSTLTGTIDSLAVVGESASDDLNIVQLLDFSKSFDGPTTATGTATLTFSLTNPGTDLADGLAFSDDLDSVLPGLVATSLPPQPCGASSAITGTSLLTFTGGELESMDTCTFDVVVQVPVTATAGTYPNATSVLSQNGLLVSEPATADLTIEPPPTFAKVFSPDTIFALGVSTLQFTIDNSASALAATGLSFLDTLPAGVVITTPAVTTNTCGGTLTAGAGAGSITLSSGSVDAGATCTVEVDVTTTASGAFVNTTGDLESSSGNSGTATDTLTATPVANLGVTKEGPQSIIVGETLTYTLEVTNFGPDTATNTILADVTPTGLTFDSATTPCESGFPCNLGALALDDVVTVMVSFTVPFDYGGPNPIANTATVSSDLTDTIAGNDSATAMTDVTTDDTPPTVTAISTTVGPLAACDTLQVPILGIDVTIEDDLSPLSGTDDPMNYLLLGSGPDGDFSTTGCGAVAGDDIPIEIVDLNLVGADPLLSNVSLAFAELQPSLYRFYVCDAITDGAGNALDGDTDMTAGGDREISFFRADPLNLFTNGHFDDCPATIDPWIAQVTPPNTLQTGTPGTDDADASPFSASAHFIFSTDVPSPIAQCVPVVADFPHRLDAQLRFEPMAGEQVNLVGICESYGTADCTGAILDTATMSSSIDVENAWTPFTGEFTPPVGTVSALCSFETETLTASPMFDLFLDALFAGLSAEVFTDGFESGDTTAWSAVVP